MVLDTLLVLSIIAVGAGVVILYLHPITQPYVKKYGWALVAAILTLAAFLIFRRKGGSYIEHTLKDGQEIVRQNNHAIDKIIDTAKEESLMSSLKLAERRLEVAEEREALRAEVRAAQAIDDSVVRREALIAAIARLS